MGIGLESPRSETSDKRAKTAGMCFSGFTSPATDSIYHPKKSPYEEHGGKIPMVGWLGANGGPRGGHRFDHINPRKGVRDFFGYKNPSTLGPDLRIFPNPNPNPKHSALQKCIHPF